MQEAGIQVKHRKKYKVTTDSSHPLPVFENQLNRQFMVARPDQVYVCDITCIWTQEGWLYLAVVIDLFSRKVVGWSMSSLMKATLVYDALQMAIWLRRPPPGLIVQQDSRVAVCQQSIPQSTESIWFYWQHESSGKLLG